MSRYYVKFDASAVAERVTRGAIEGLKRAGEDLLEKSQRLCPKKRGFNGGLVSTSKVEIDEETLTMRVRYTAKHAALQHESRKYKHKQGEQAKYVEQPLQENSKRYLDMVADAIRTDMSR